MQRMIVSVEKYCTDVGLKLEPNKCKYLSYSWTGRNRVTISNKLNISDAQISPIPLSSAMEYLGSPIGISKAAKMKITNQLLPKFVSNMRPILLSSLKFMQKLYNIRRICTPALDYIFLNGVVSLKSLKTLDASIRGMICNTLNITGQPIDSYYVSWVDRGLGPQCLFERYHVLQIRTYVGVRLSSDDKVWSLFEHFFDEEVVVYVWV